MTRTDTDAPFFPKPFVAIRVGPRTWVEELPPRRWILGSGSEADVTLSGIGIAQEHLSLTWSSESVVASACADEAPAFLNGKRLTEQAELRPGDELSVGTVQLVFGLSPTSSRSGRRALTHHEFCERLYSEVARAARHGRNTALVMLQARPGEARKVSQAALDTFRAGDLVGTYGHDEIEFLLSDTTADLARGVVERVLEESGIQDVAVGIAVAPTHGEHPERLLRAVRHALFLSTETGLMEAPPQRPPSTAADLPEMVDNASRAVVRSLSELAETAEAVLLHGEPSSGKSVFARVLHHKGPQHAKPFLTISCGGRSAETFAQSLEDARNRFVKAGGGILLLDEVGDLPDGQQETLWQFLEALTDVRTIATTHRLLRAMVERGAFHAGLFDRIAAHEVEVPPLRSRPDDILPLAGRFAVEAGARTPIPFSAGAVARLRSYPWPGNVLEMRNALERAVRLAQGGEILAEHLPNETLPQAGSEGKLREHVDSVERDAIVKALADTNHNQTHAAKRLGVSRRALIYKMEKYGLKPPPGSIRRGA